MEKKLKILLIIVAVIGLVMISDIGYSFVISGKAVTYPERHKITCVDSDANEDYPDGLNYFVKGYVQFGNKKTYDKCLGRNTLKEMYCRNTKVYEQPMSKRVTCKNGCTKGTCISCGDGTCQQQENSLTCPEDCDTTPPQAAVAVSPTTITQGESVIISCTATDETDPDPSTSAYVTKPDGISIPANQFADTEQTGTYTVTCTATDASGNTASATTTFITSENLVNRRQLNSYEDRQVFLVSDKDWHKVINLVSIAVWTDENGILHKYPVLIFHEEESGAFDADSAIYFLQQYNPSRVVIVGEIPIELENLVTELPPLGGGINKDAVTKADLDNYHNYWSSIKNVVYIKDDYETALLASAYASLINAPLVIQGSESDTPSIVNGKNVIGIGACPDKIQCNEHYDSLEELQLKYKELTNTDKIILVNPADWDIAYTKEDFKPEKSSMIIKRLYTKTSLPAPFLASAKHELIISTNLVEYDLVDSFLEKQLETLGIKEGYITIMADNSAIEMADNIGNYSTGKPYWRAVEEFYQDTDDFPAFLEFKLGRIFSLTTSDVSSYVARVLFYEELPSSRNFATLWTADRGIFSNKPSGELIGSVLSDMGYNDQSIYMDDGVNRWFNLTRDMENNFYITYIGHGTLGGGSQGIDTLTLNKEKIWLSPSIIASIACSTCSYGAFSTPVMSRVFCTNVIRRGAIAHIGSVKTTSPTGAIEKGFFSSLVEGKDIGTAFFDLQTLGESIGRHDFILIGDPTFQPNLNHADYGGNSIEFRIEDGESPLHKSIIITVPETSFSWSTNYLYIFGALAYFMKEPFGVSNLGTSLYKLGLSDGKIYCSLYGRPLYAKVINLPEGYKVAGIKSVERNFEGIGLQQYNLSYTGALQDYPKGIIGEDGEIFDRVHGMIDYVFVTLAKNPGSNELLVSVRQSIYEPAFDSGKRPSHEIRIKIELEEEQT